ncbi:TPA: hypothetical protein H2R31_005152, partial [Salmonella enterica]|nr:hypothetical protein [Salmonella enterica]
NGPGNLSLSGSKLTATNGYVNLTGGSGINLTNGNISAQNDITINASNGGVTISGKNGGAGMAKITSTAGNITVSGDATVTGEKAGINLNNVNMTAQAGSITVNGVGKTLDYSGDSGGILLNGKVLFQSKENTLNGTYNGPANYDSYYQSGGLSVGQDADVHFKGDTTINATSQKGGRFSTGIHLNSNGKMSFDDGTANVNAVGGLMMESFTDWLSVPEFHVNNATLNLNASSSDWIAFATLSDYGYFTDASEDSGYKFTGNGNINIKGVSGSDYGVQIRHFNNEGLTGNFSVTGISDSGPGVIVDKNANVVLHNATITGISKTGTGIQFNAGAQSTNKAHQVNLNGNTLTGISGTGTGININGNNVTITNGSLNGTSNGTGAGVQLTGGTNYTVDGATVQGSSQAGSGVSVGGNLTVNNATVNGSTATGSGVDIGGSLNTSNTSITGNASGNGSGVSLHGNITGDAADKNVITGHASQGNGLLVSGDAVAA